MDEIFTKGIRFALYITVSNFSFPSFLPLVLVQGQPLRETLLLASNPGRVDIQALNGLVQCTLEVLGILVGKELLDILDERSIRRLREWVLDTGTQHRHG